MVAFVAMPVLERGGAAVLGESLAVAREHPAVAELEADKLETRRFQHRGHGGQREAALVDVQHEIAAAR